MKKDKEIVILDILIGLSFLAIIGIVIGISILTL